MRAFVVSTVPNSGLASLDGIRFLNIYGTETCKRLICYEIVTHFNIASSMLSKQQKCDRYKAFIRHLLDTYKHAEAVTESVLSQE